MPCDHSRAQQEEERLSSFLGRTQPMKSHGLCLPRPCQPPFLLYKSALLPLRVAPHGCRPQIAILCWSQINPSLLEKYLAVCLFQVNVLEYGGSLFQYGRCPYKKRRRDTEKHERDTMWWLIQRFEWCVCKAKGHQGLPATAEAKRKARNRLSPRASESTWPSQYLDFRHLACRTVRE